MRTNYSLQSMVAIMANAYPSPCDTCQNPCTGGYGCTDWQIRYRYRQKQINAYARKLYQSQEGKTTKFVYEHPDSVRRYLRISPCAACKAEAVCDTPCPAYIRWYDMRMAVARRRLGL